MHQINTLGCLTKMAARVEEVRTLETRDPDATEPMLAADLQRPQDASQVMKILGQSLPLPEELRHLRRIHKRPNVGGCSSQGKSGAAVAQGQRGSAKTGPVRLSVLLCRVEDMPKLSLLVGSHCRALDH